MSDTERLRQLRESLTNHAPDADGLRRIEKIREAGKHLGTEIIAACPPGRERSLALTELETSVMWAVKAVVLPPVRLDD